MQTLSWHQRFGWETLRCRIYVMANIWTLQKCCPLPLGTCGGCLVWVFSVVISEGHSYRGGITGGPVGDLCRGYKVVLEVRGMNCNRMEQKLGIIPAPGCVRCPWPFRINSKYYTLGTITNIYFQLTQQKMLKTQYFEETRYLKKSSIILDAALRNILLK